MKYLNIVSNIAYPIVGWFGDWTTFIAGIILCVGSGVMHYYEEYTEARPNWSVLADWNCNCSKLAGFDLLRSSVCGPAEMGELEVAGL